LEDDEPGKRTRGRRKSVELSIAMRDVANLPTLLEADEAKGFPFESFDSAEHSDATMLPSETSAASRQDARAARMPRASLVERAATSEEAADLTPLLLAPGLRPDRLAAATKMGIKRVSMPPKLVHPVRRRDTGVALDPLPASELQRLLRLANASDSGELIRVPASTLASLLAASQAPSEIETDLGI
jgi:hypothetical protein